MPIGMETAYRVPSAAEFATAARERTNQYGLWGLLLALGLGAASASLGAAGIALSGAGLVALLLLVLLWHYPRISLYVTFTAACLFELFPTGFADALTDQVPFFWNINTIVQRYAHVEFKGFPLNLFEVLVLIAGLWSLIRAGVMKQVGLRAGPLFRPIALYIAFVIFGWAHGAATGGDFIISLQEVRAQFYFLLAYLMAVNLVREQRDVNALLWMLAICIGFKGVLYTFRRYVTLAGLPVPDQGVGSHEEAFLFNAFVILLMVLGLCSAHRRLQRVMWLLLPFVILGSLATNRRAGTAALLLALPILLLAAYRALPRRRKMVLGTGLALLVGFSLYYPAFKNSRSMLALPARAIASQFQPSARDRSSNQYRIAENACLKATIRLAPLQGYGYGKPMLHAVPIADISSLYPWWDIMPHNQILWVWMRVGTFGFLAFWIMIAAILMAAGRLCQPRDNPSQECVVGLFVLMLIMMLVIFGLLDLQLSNFRNMLFAGFWTGVLGIVLRPEPPRTQPV